jgi:hypothetical protein
MRRRLILALFAAAAAGPALAADAKKPVAPVGTYVDLDEVGLPVILDGRLVNYVFVQIRLMLAPGANQMAIQAKEPFFRDGLVRAAHRTPFAIPGDPNHIDEAALKRTMAAVAAGIAGPRAIASVQIMRKAAQRMVVMPRKDATPPA